MNERVAIGSGGAGGRGGGVTDLIDFARTSGVNHDPIIRQGLADLYAKARIQKFLSMRTLTAASQGKVPGPEGSIGKLFGARVMTQMGELALSIAGPSGVVRADERYRWNQGMLGAPAAHIAGGSDQVMMNIIGERVLGLPGEPRPDKGVAWKSVPR
jgi:alkylation response protein AidB-like acyl-CoA dehydrogenase